jgi:lysine 2,3-aminomutase
VDESLTIQRELWGTLSGLAMPTLSLDIPNGGGKTTLAPNFLVEQEEGRRVYRGWDGVTGEYVNPDPAGHRLPADWRDYDPEWQRTRDAKNWTTANRDPEAEI